MALPLLDVTLDDEQFEKHVIAGFFFSHGMTDLEEDRLDLEGFLALASIVYAPGHK